MRKTTLLKNVFACIIQKKPADAKIVIDLLHSMGIKNYNYYIDFKDALFDFDKFYSTRYPDFILSDWYNNDFNNIGIVEIYNRSKLKKVPLFILTDKHKIEEHKDNSRMDISIFISKPISFKTLQTQIIKSLAGKFCIINSFKEETEDT
jgi:DNA-binding NtrC family response regulator